MNTIFGVKNCSNSNVCMVLANGDTGQLSAHIDGCSYVNGGWRAVLDRSVSANINVTITYIAVYFG